MSIINFNDLTPLSILEKRRNKYIIIETGEVVTVSDYCHLSLTLRKEDFFYYNETLKKYCLKEGTSEKLGNQIIYILLDDFHFAEKQLAKYNGIVCTKTEDENGVSLVRFNKKV